MDTGIFFIRGTVVSRRESRVAIPLRSSNGMVSHRIESIETSSRCFTYTPVTIIQPWGGILAGEEGESI